MLALVALLSLAARSVAAEAEQLGQLGGLVRLENEAVIARDSDEEKDLALTMLHRWGLGSERQFMELAGKLPMLQQARPDTACKKSCHLGYPSLDLLQYRSCSSVSFICTLLQGESLAAVGVQLESSPRSC